MIIKSSIHWVAWRFYVILCSTAREVVNLLNKYRPESKIARKLRLKKLAEDQAAGKDTILTKKPIVVQQGINKVTTLVEQKKAKLVVISHDVDPIEVSTLP